MSKKLTNNNNITLAPIPDIKIVVKNLFSLNSDLERINTINNIAVDKIKTEPKEKTLNKPIIMPIRIISDFFAFGENNIAF